jgi:hypothetical protein
MKKSGDTRGVPHPGNKIHIPLDEKTAVKAFFKVKPTEDMPRPGAANKAKKKSTKKRRHA